MNSQMKIAIKNFTNCKSQNSVLTCTRLSSFLMQINNLKPLIQQFMLPVKETWLFFIVMLFSIIDRQSPAVKKYFGTCIICTLQLFIMLKDAKTR